MLLVVLPYKNGRVFGEMKLILYMFEVGIGFGMLIWMCIWFLQGVQDNASMSASPKARCNLFNNFKN